MHIAFVNILFVSMLFFIISSPVFSCGSISQKSAAAGKEKMAVRKQKGRLGIKPAEKLGCGMTAIAKFEWKIDSTGTAKRHDQESQVDLKGNFGIEEE